MPKPRTFQDWLQARPFPAVAHDLLPDGRVVLLRPKFTARGLQWLQQRLRRPYFRVHLDPLGSCLWLHMDGQRTVAELAELQRLAFGARAEPSEARAIAFVRQLVAGRFAQLEAPGKPPEPSRSSVVQSE